MKKIPTLFVREFKNNKIIGITDNITPGMEWVLNGDGVATVKYDGSCCAVIDGLFYKRYDAKNGKTPPAGAIPCCDPDPVTGHWPHWLRLDVMTKSDKWLFDAFANYLIDTDFKRIEDGTYEAVGPQFNGNHHALAHNILVKHGADVIDVPRTFEGIRDYLAGHMIEGIVFWKDGEPQCKIKRSDFGFKWP